MRSYWAAPLADDRLFDIVLRSKATDLISSRSENENDSLLWRFQYLVLHPWLGRTISEPGALDWSIAAQSPGRVRGDRGGPQQPHNGAGRSDKAFHERE